MTVGNVARTPRPGRATGQTATERQFRVLCTATGPTGFVFGLLCLDTFRAQAWPPAPGAALAAWLLVFGIPVLIGILATWAPLRLLRTLALAEGVVFLAILCFWLVVRAEPLPAGADIPWAISLTGIPAVAVAAATRDRIGWAYTVLVCTLSGILRSATSTDPHPVLVGIEDALYALLVISVFVGLTIMARRGAARVDDSARITRAAVAARAARVARKRERLTIDALVHDSVISTLLMAGRGGIPTETLSRHAASTLDRLDALRMPRSNRSLPGNEVADRLEQLAAELAPDAIVQADLDENLAVPAVAVTALLGAVGEALRNSVAAAALGAHHRVVRTVSVRGHHGGIRVVVHDDGVGFDPALVPSERLGIAQSIIGRMERLSGGEARVRSRPGAGTEVEVSWTPEPRRPAVIASAAAPAVQRPAPAAGPLEPAAHSAAAPAVAMITPDAQPAPPFSDAATTEIDAPRTVVRLPRPLSLGILAMFIGVHALLAFGDYEPLFGLPWEIAGFAAVSSAAVLISRAGADHLPRTAAVIVLVLCAVATALVSEPMTAVQDTPFGHWYLGAVTLLLVVLAVRGREGFAWASYLIVSAITILWALSNGLTVVDGVLLVVRHAGTLLAGTLFAVGLKRSALTLAVLNRARAQNAAAAATAVAAIEERESQLARVNVLCRPTLEGLARSDDICPEMRAECLLVEATLRDAMRARALFVEPLVTATRAARLRGVEVTLLDDSGDHPPVEAARVAVAVADQLDSLYSGSLTARVLPADRATIASIVIESDDNRMLVVTPEGLLRDA
ncbi:two-component sensor histidine kinase [Cryobacterium sp. MP_M5]|uniref:sensor histidine kinase n=1 Tax=unclassified Cryobacterium TaxID=2649013 RepID=UPI0018C9A217|nr:MULTISPECIES: ATP-binding protein [unclassified Cryobacterium]MBG6056889.1 two-component sensor histidine kinase [Cryobacterium sp. MP_M3]MEC5175088.1 two-component sensor histidine kinase [Cryobacterium sp. MP_M5]